jgi:dynein heavy chain
MIPLYVGLSANIQLNPKEWLRWFSSTKPEPEKTQLPGEWASKCDDDLKQMIILRCFRPDRVRFAIVNFVNAYFKTADFTTPRSCSIAEIYALSRPETPIIFLMAPGVDPTEQLKRYAEEIKIKVVGISLGKGQGEKAKSILKACSLDGNWCFLSNCHLSVGLLPELENIMDELIADGQMLANFRILMSAGALA